jgi:hypothetical protein
MGHLARVQDGRWRATGSAVGQSADTLLVRPVARPAIVSSGRVVEMDFVERCLAVATITSVIVLVAGFIWLMVY